MSGRSTRSLGARGENLACRALRRRGYVILARGYRTRFGEIDIVARDGEVIVFVEVKTRSSVSFGGPLAAVTPDKQQRLVRMARDFLLRRRLDAAPCRFDVVGIRTERGALHLEIVRDAFTGDA